jgi:hypothetical protein
MVFQGFTMAGLLEVHFAYGLKGSSRQAYNVVPANAGIHLTSF